MICAGRISLPFGGSERIYRAHAMYQTLFIKAEIPTARAPTNDRCRPQRANVLSPNSISMPANLDSSVFLGILVILAGRRTNNAEGNRARAIV